MSGAATWEPESLEAESPLLVGAGFFCDGLPWSFQHLSRVWNAYGSNHTRNLNFGAEHRRMEGGWKPKQRTQWEMWTSRA